MPEKRSSMPMSTRGNDFDDDEEDVTQGASKTAPDEVVLGGSFFQFG